MCLYVCAHISALPVLHYNFRSTKLYHFIINHAIKMKKGNNSVFSLVCM